MYKMNTYVDKLEHGIIVNNLRALIPTSHLVIINEENKNLTKLKLDKLVGYFNPITIVQSETNN